MGLSRSLSTGASSLRAHQQRFDVISNNISNVNTTGYKSTRANFIDQFSQIYNYGKAPDSVGGKGVGGSDPLQFGLGVRMGSITTNMTQGVLETTGRSLDLSLQGDGYFVYNNNGKQVYSRAGILNRDKDGFFVDASTGAYAQGYNLETDANGLIQKDSDGINMLNRTLTNLKVDPKTISPARQTENLGLTGNLNSGSAVGTTKQTSINIFDTSGASHSLLLTFTKTATGWDVAAQTEGAAVGAATPITFNPDGTLNTPTSITLTSADLSTATTVPNSFLKDVTIKLADPTNKLTGLTQYGGPNTATANEQDGYQTGTLTDISFDREGKVWGAFTNGQSEKLGQLAVAKFSNPAALVKEGQNFMNIAPDSGLANIGTAGESFPSTQVVAGSIEQSNVDLTYEFTDMITTQRGFEAASRTITVTDQMLAELNNLKR